jgi:hypothetical protein
MSQLWCPVCCGYMLDYDSNSSLILHWFESMINCLRASLSLLFESMIDYLLESQTAPLWLWKHLPPHTGPLLDLAPQTHLTNTHRYGHTFALVLRSWLW